MYTGRCNKTLTIRGTDLRWRGLSVLHSFILYFFFLLFFSFGTAADRNDRNTFSLAIAGKCCRRCWLLFCIMHCNPVFKKKNECCTRLNCYCNRIVMQLASMQSVKICIQWTSLNTQICLQRNRSLISDFLFWNFSGVETIWVRVGFGLVWHSRSHFVICTINN